MNEQEILDDVKIDNLSVVFEICSGRRAATVPSECPSSPPLGRVTLRPRCNRGKKSFGLISLRDYINEKTL
jgi:hypothetical protein